MRDATGRFVTIADSISSFLGLPLESSAVRVGKSNSGELGREESRPSAPAPAAVASPCIELQDILSRCSVSGHAALPLLRQSDLHSYLPSFNRAFHILFFILSEFSPRLLRPQPPPHGYPTVGLCFR
jgi:hypothetical protein